MIKLIHFIFIKLAHPIEKIVDIFRKPEFKINSNQYLDALANLKSGDILLSKDDLMMSNYLIPGDYKHAAIYIDGYVYEAITEGVRKVHISEWMYKKDHIAAVSTPQLITKKNLSLGIKFLIKQLGKPYDFEFSLSNQSAWYCSELAYGFLKIASPKLVKKFTLRKTLGVKTVTPSDFWNAVDSGKFIKVVKYN